MKLWIHHPACEDGPVSLRRWVAYLIASKLDEWSRRLEHFALYYGTDRYDDDIPF